MRQPLAYGLRHSSQAGTIRPVVLWYQECWYEVKFGRRLNRLQTGGRARKGEQGSKGKRKCDTCLIMVAVLVPSIASYSDHQYGAVSAGGFVCAWRKQQRTNLDVVRVLVWRCVFLVSTATTNSPPLPVSCLSLPQA